MYYLFHLDFTELLAFSSTSSSSLSGEVEDVEASLKVF
jgi:hypothetical protein